MPVCHCNDDHFFSLSLSSSHLLALVQKINCNHGNNFHRLSSRLSWLVFHDIYLLQCINIDWLQVWAGKKGERRSENGQLCAVRIVFMCMCMWVCLMCIFSCLFCMRQNNDNSYSEKEDTTQWLAVVELCSAMLNSLHHIAHHIWCDHFAVSARSLVRSQINDFSSIGNFNLKLFWCICWLSSDLFVSYIYTPSYKY